MPKPMNTKAKSSLTFQDSYTAWNNLTIDPKKKATIFVALRYFEMLGEEHPNIDELAKMSLVDLEKLCGELSVVVSQGKVNTSSQP